MLHGESCKYAEQVICHAEQGAAVADFSYGTSMASVLVFFSTKVWARLSAS